MIRNSAFVLLLISLLLFWPVAIFLPRQSLFDAINSISAMVGLGVIIAYWPGMKAAMLEDPARLERGHYLIVGIFATWIAVISRVLWLAVWRILGEPEGGLDHIFFAFIAYVAISGGIMHLLSPAVIDGKVPVQGWKHLRLALIMGFVVWVIIELVRWYYDVPGIPHA